MKNTIKILMALVFVSLFFGCAKEKLYEPGKADDPNCEGVYFPSQEVSGVFAPADDFTFDVKVARTKDAEALTVPLAVKCDSIHLFEIPELKFEAGQAEQTLTIKFGKEIGKEMVKGIAHTLVLSIDDPLYASQYSTNSNVFAIDVIVEDFKSLGKAIFIDEFEFGDEQYEVEILQNQVDKSEFRLLNPYDEGNAIHGWTSTEPAVEKLNFKILESGTVINKGSKYEFTIKGDDLVYFEDYYTGDSSTAGGSPCDIMAYSPFYNKEFVIGAAEADCAESRVMNYQEPDAEGNVLPSVVQLMPTYLLAHDGRGWGPYPVTIIFPGGKLVDYTVIPTASECKDGKVVVNFTLGADVKKVKYNVYEGELTSKEIRGKVNLIGAGEEKADSLVFEGTTPEAAEITVECEKTGIYTVVAVSFDKAKVGEKKSSGSASFGFFLPEEKEKVEIDFIAGLEDTPARYAKDGYKDNNSLQFYASGKDIKTVKYYLKDYAKEIAGETEEETLKTLDSLKTAVATYGSSFSEKIVGLVNEPGGYCDVFKDLNPLTKYVLIIYAYNGYTSTTVVCEHSTNGLPIESKGKGTFTYNSCWEYSDDAGEVPLVIDLEYFLDPNITTEGNYQIHGWCSGDAVMKFKQFASKPEDKIDSCYVVTSDTKESYPAAGVSAFYCMELKDFVKTYSEKSGYPEAVIWAGYGIEDLKESYSCYDKDAKCYNFVVAYVDQGLGLRGVGIETFDVSGEPVQKSAVRTFGKTVKKIDGKSVSTLSHYPVAGLVSKKYFDNKPCFKVLDVNYSAEKAKVSRVLRNNFVEKR